MELKGFDVVLTPPKTHPPCLTLGRTLRGCAVHITKQTCIDYYTCSRDHPSLPLQQASALSREKKLPRVYIAANSGARIGLAEELKQLYRVAWVDEAEPDKGYKYLYLSSADYMKV